MHLKLNSCRRPCEQFPRVQGSSLDRKLIVVRDPSLHWLLIIIWFQINPQPVTHVSSSRRHFSIRSEPEIRQGSGARLVGVEEDVPRRAAMAVAQRRTYLGRRRASASRDACGSGSGSGSGGGGGGGGAPFYKKSKARTSRCVPAAAEVAAPQSSQSKSSLAACWTSSATSWRETAARPQRL